jgi:AbrB family looped-hinge helix DNA binding protein
MAKTNAKSTSSARVILDRSGRLVIPKKIRDAMGLKAGTRLWMVWDGDRLLLKPVTPGTHLE